jgi:Protein of unknown function (DUF2848)
VKHLDLQILAADGHVKMAGFAIDQVLLAGYTGRDRASVLHHIRELEALGVAPPERVPAIYVVEPDLLTTADHIDVDEHQTSGEAEFYLVPTPNGLLVGVGSDHTDRKHEAIDVAASKGLCPKVVSGAVWRHADIQDHWDELQLRAWIADAAGARHLYQQGALANFLAVSDLLDELAQAGYADLERRLIFGGTLAVIGGFAQAFGRPLDVELYDPRLDRKLALSYRVDVRAA